MAELRLKTRQRELEIEKVKKEVQVEEEACEAIKDLSTRMHKEHTKLKKERDEYRKQSHNSGVIASRLEVQLEEARQRNRELFSDS